MPDSDNKPPYSSLIELLIPWRSGGTVGQNDIQRLERLIDNDTLEPMGPVSPEITLIRTKATYESQNEHRQYRHVLAWPTSDG